LEPAMTPSRLSVEGPLGSALVQTRRYFTPHAEVSEDDRALHLQGGRSGDSFYRDRWSHDKVVRSTHGVNCTGSCSWKVYVKDGIITWEAQQTDYPSVGEDRPEYEPRGCPRGAAFSWYTYSPTRVRYPYVRGTLLSMFREARKRLGDPVLAWAEIVQDPQKSHRYTSGRGPGAGADRRRARAHGPALGAGPDRRVRPHSGDVDGQLRLGRAVQRAHRRPAAQLLRLVRGPAGGLPAEIRRPDRRARVPCLV